MAPVERSNRETSGSPAADLAFCDEVLPEVSRTFAISIQSLPSGLREAVTVAYLLCRAVDTVEDDRRVSPERRGELFDSFDAALAAGAAGDVGPAHGFARAARESNLGGNEAERALCRGAPALFRAFSSLPEGQRSAVLSRVAEMSRGMRLYSLRADACAGMRLEDLTDLEQYCYYVAGTVGELLTDLFLDGCPLGPAMREQAYRLGVSFGIGLQLVNILKDVAEDSARNDVFLPRAMAEEHGVDLDRLFEPSLRPAGLELVRTLSVRARDHLENAERYTLAWPATRTGGHVRLFCAVPLALGFGTLREIEIGDDTLIPGRAPSVSRAFVGEVSALALGAACLDDLDESNAAFTRLFGRARGVTVRPTPIDVPARAEVRG
jgi:farnesyl-diphosphate farnesyltransferase